MERTKEDPMNRQRKILLFALILFFEGRPIIMVTDNSIPNPPRSPLY